MAETPTLVIGLGNPILGDDGVGWRVVEALERRLAADTAARAAVGRVEIDQLCLGGLSLMERIVGYDRVVIADAVLGPGTPGVVRALPLSAVATVRMGHLDSSHDASFPEALAAGRALGVGLPDEITVVSVAVKDVDAFGESLSPPVERAVDGAADRIIAVLTDARERAD